MLTFYVLCIFLAKSVVYSQNYTYLTMLTFKNVTYAKQAL